MNKLMYIPVAALIITACTDNSKQLQELKTLRIQDSITTLQAQQKDSSIVSYIKTLDEIQNNIDSIKAKEKIVSFSKGGEPPHSLISDIKSLDAKIVRENRRIYLLEKRLKKEDKKDLDLEKVVKHLTKELAEKDVQIADLQTKLAESNNTLKIITEQFNDSIAVIHRQREEINAMRSAVNTVYYALGSAKELKKHGVITKEGSIIGIGGATELKPDFNNSYFTEGDLTKMKDIPLNGKFVRLITNHPTGSYKVSGDTLHITEASSFWSESKYLVIELK
jgi:organic radical activating enzyme